MATVRRLRKEASDLLRIAKTAFKFIRDNQVGDEHDRVQLLEDMREVLDRADPPPSMEDLLKIKLVMTNPTADAIIKVLEYRVKQFEDEAPVLEAVQDGIRRTKQRAFIELDIIPEVLRRLHYVLSHTEVGQQSKPFKRLADQIDDELSAKNPMEILGRLGL